MQKIENYMNCTLDARAHQRKDGSGWAAQVDVQQRGSDSTLVTQFSLDGVFPNAEKAIEAALQMGHRKVDVG